MSQALSSARRRRTNDTSSAQNMPPPPQQVPNRGVPLTGQQGIQQQQQNRGMSGGLTLPQVIYLVDTRLTNLENFMKEVKEKGVPSSSLSTATTTTTPKNNQQIQQEQQPENPDTEYKIEMLVMEIENLKDIVLKLQSYTMEVNRQLLEERLEKKELLETLQKQTIIEGEEDEENEPLATHSTDL